MLNDFDKDLADIDLTADNASELILAAANNRAKGLSDKNGSIIGDNKLLKESNSALTAAAAAADLKQAEKDNDHARINELLKKSNTDSEAAWSLKDKEKDERIAGFEKEQRTRIVDDGINALLDEYNVSPLHRGDKFKAMKLDSTIVDGKAMIGDQTQSDYMKTWSETDSGKASVIGQQNSNSGGLGGERSPSTSVVVNEAAEAAIKSGDGVALLNARLKNHF